MAEFGSAQEALNGKDLLNVLPQRPPNNSYASGNRQKKEAAENLSSKHYRETLEAYNTRNRDILEERMNLLKQFLTLKTEFDSLEEAEKWLLISMAIRNQSSLLGFIQDDDK